MSVLLNNSKSTIFALATGSGHGAVAIIRASGPYCASILEALAGPLPKARQASLRFLHHKEDILDHALILWFPAPRSYTGEDSFELHLHAGPAIIDAVSNALIDLGARPAEAGEFTKKAVQQGRLDLLQAEAIADLVEAETQAQRQQALRQADGALSQLYQQWSSRLKSILAQQEALIDFPDEDLPPEVGATLEQAQKTLLSEIEEHLHDERGELTRNGMTVVIAGSPNVGKSSLLNALSGEDAAIVTHHAGTTRDAISVDWLLDGIKLRLTDTAGLRETDDPIEAEGIKRTYRHIEKADLVLHLLGPGEDCTILSPGEITLRTKTDLSPALPHELGISTTTSEGLSSLKDELRAYLAKLLAKKTTPPLTRARHRAGLEETRRHLLAAQSASWPELKGEELRLAMQALGRLTGHVDIEALLDTIFSQFCIGK